MTHPALIDISLPIDDRVVLYPGDARPTLRRLSSIDTGDSLTASELTIGCHIGTHVDAPAHFFRNGVTVAELPLLHFHGAAHVLEFPSCEAVTADMIRQFHPKPSSHLLLKTRNSALLEETEFRADYCYLAPGAAEALLQFQPASVGFDYYSLDHPRDASFSAHCAIAMAGLPVFVCLDLRSVEPGEYDFFALPLNVPGLDGIPVRAVLFTRPPQEAARSSEKPPAES